MGRSNQIRKAFDIFFKLQNDQFSIADKFGDGDDDDDDEFSVEKFVRMLQNENEALSGLKKFCKVAPLLNSSKSRFDIVDRYLSAFPDGKTIIQYFNVRHYGMAVACYASKALTTILCQTARVLRNKQAAGIQIANSLLQTKMSRIISMLQLSHVEPVLVTLDLLTAVVMQGNEVATLMINKLQFEKKPLAELFLYNSVHENSHKKQAIRLGVVRFVVGLFLAGNEDLIMLMFYSKGFLDVILQQISHDRSARSIYSLLTTMLTKAIRNDCLAKAAKKAILSRKGVLSSIAELLEWNSVMDISMEKDVLNDDAKIEKSKIHQLAFDFLHAACCSPKFGVVFSFTFTDASVSNHFLLLFLLEMKEKVANISLLSKLTVEIFQHYPALLLYYFKSTTLDFQPPFCSQWQSNCDLLQDIYSSQPLVPAALQYIIENKKTFEDVQIQIQAEIVMAGIIPSIWNIDMFTTVISHPEKTVQLKGLIILSSALLRLQSALEFLKKAFKKKIGLKQKFCNELCNVLQSLCKRQIPTIKNLMIQWKSMCKENVVDERETNMLKVLQLYQQVFLVSFDAGVFNFCDLLIGLSQVSSWNSGRKSILLVLDILLPSLRNYNWFSMEKSEMSPYAVFLNFTLELMHNSSDLTLIDKSLQLLRMVNNTISLIEDDDNNVEFNTWLHFLDLLRKESHHSVSLDNKNKKDDVFSFFVKTCSSVANNINRYSQKQLKLMKECDASALVTDSALKKWIESLPLVDIERSDTDDVSASAAMEAELKENEHDFPVSKLLIATFDEIKFLDTAQSSGNIDQLDRFLESVLITLFHHKVFSNKSELFAKVLSVLFSEITDPAAFPLLSKCYQHISAFVGSLALLDNNMVLTVKVDHSDNNTDMDLPQLNSVVNRCFSFVKDLDSNVFNLVQETIFVENNLAGFLYHLVGLAAVLQCSAKSVKFQDLFLSLSRKLQNFFDSIGIIDEKGALSDQDGSESPATASNNVQPTECTGTTVSIEIKRTQYTLLLQKVLENNYVKSLYLNNEIILRETASFFDSFLSNLICRLLSNHCDIPPLYVEKLKASVVEILVKSLNDTREIVLDSFQEWVVAVNDNDVEKIFTAAVSKECISKYGKRCFSIVCICLKTLLERDFRSYSVQFIRDLFQIFMNPLFDDERSILLALLNRLLRCNASVALFVPEDAADWCVNRLDNDDVVSLLQVILTQNFALQKHYLYLCCSDETCKLSNLKKSIKRLHLPLIAFILTHSHRTDTDSSLLEVVSCFEKHLFKALLNVDKELKDNEVLLLLWLITGNHLSSKRLKKLQNKLPSALESDFEFSKRWKVLHCYMKNCSSDDSTQILFLAKVANCLMSLCCTMMKKDDSRLNSVVKNLAQILLELVSLSYDSLKDAIDLQLWCRFVTSSLRHQLHECDALAAVLHILKIIGSRFDLCADDITPEQLHTMVTHHSKFLEIMMSGDEQWKDAKLSLLQLLREIILHCDADHLKSNDFVYLLASYGATLSHCDQILYQIMQIYEWKEIPASKYKPFFWGQPAMSFYPSLNKKLQSLNEKPDPNKVLDCLNQEIMVTTLKKFPIGRRIQVAEKFEGKSVDELAAMSSELLIEENASCYDPAFLLDILVLFLNRDNRFDPLVILTSNLLPFFFQCLSSRCQHIRHLATQCLVLCEGHIKATQLLMRDIVLVLIRLVKASIILSDDGKTVRKHSSLATLYLSHAATFLVQNGDPLLKSVFIRLFNQPRMNLNSVPNFVSYFFSNSSKYKQDRIWMLQLLRDGMRDVVDYRVAETSKIFRSMISFYGSALCSVKCRKLIMEVIAKACKMREAAIDLVYRCALLSWLQGVICRQRMRSSASGKKASCVELADLVAILVSIWGSITVNRKHSEKGLIVELLDFALPQLVPLYIELLQHCMQAASEETEQSIPPLQTLCDLMRLLWEALSFDHVRADGKRLLRSKITLSSQQFAIVRKFSEFAEEKHRHVIEYSLYVTIYLQPDELISIESLNSNLIWCLNTWMKIIERISSPVLLDVLKWILSRLKNLDNSEKETFNDFKLSVARCAEMLCATESSSLTKRSLEVLHSICCVLLCIEQNYSDDTMHDVRIQFYRKCVNEKSIQDTE